jgi:hypothetical protein
LLVKVTSNDADGVPPTITIAGELVVVEPFSCDSVTEPSITVTDQLSVLPACPAFVTVRVSLTVPQVKCSGPKGVTDNVGCGGTGVLVGVGGIGVSVGGIGVYVGGIGVYVGGIGVSVGVGGRGVGVGVFGPVVTVGGNGVRVGRGVGVRVGSGGRGVGVGVFSPVVTVGVIARAVAVCAIDS